MTESSSTSPLIPRQVLFGNPANVSPEISPDGRRVAWIAPHEGVLNVWVSDLPAVAGTERVVTADRDRGVRQFSWSPDGTRILYLQDKDGDENWRLLDVTLDTGEQRDLTPAGSQTNIVKLSKRRPNEILVSININNPQLHDVYRLDLTTGELTMVCPNPGFVDFVADEDFVVRAALAPQPDGGMAILVRDDETADWRALLTVGQEDALITGPLAFSLDGSRLLCLTSADANAGQLVWLDTTTGARQIVAGDPVYDVSDVRLHPDTNEPQIAYIRRDRSDPVVLDPAVAADVAMLTALDGGDPAVAHGDDADDVWLVASTHDNGPVRYYAHYRGAHKDAGSKPTFLFASRPELYEYTLAPMEPFSIRSRDGLDLHGYVTFPPGAQRRDLPAVINVHGGPWHRDSWGFHSEAQWLANRGYVCIQVNFRGSTGYGKRFLNAGDREWGAKMHDDLLDALDWAVQLGWVDRDRVGIYGGSYGGYASLVGATFTPDTFRCAVAAVAPVNLSTFIKSIPPYWTPLLTMLHTRIGNPDTEADFLWSRSPLSKVDEIRIPLLIAQGANDPRVPETESRQIVEALQARGIEHTYLLFPDEGHGMARPHNRLRFYAEAERFLAQHLGGRCEDATG